MQPSSESLLGFREYLRVLSRRRNTIIFAVGVVATIALASALVQTPKYVATSSVLIKSSNTATLLNPNGASAANNPAMQLQTEIDVITGQPVKKAVERELGFAPPVSVAPHGQAQVIDISAESTDPPSAATIANSYATAFVKYSQTQDINAALAAEAQLQARISDLQGQIDALNNQIRAADPKSQAQADATLTPQVSSLLQQQGTFKQQLGQIQLQAAVSSGDAQLSSEATVPTSPVSPKPFKDLVLAILAGLMLGVGAAFALEYFDDSVKSRDDLDRVLAGVPNVGLISQVPGWKDKAQPMLVTLTDPNSSPAESYRALRTSLQFLSLDKPLRTVLITSPSAGEGKTTILSNLGVALAQVGQRVIICCCDLRRPRLHEFFGLNNSVGFTSVLLGKTPLLAALQTVPSEPSLRILASGPLPANPSELLSTERAAEVLVALQGEADIVLIDSPPIVPVTDAAVLTRLVDGTLLVVTVGSTSRKHVSQALEVLNQVGARLLGTVLNNVGSEGSYAYTYEQYQVDRKAVRLRTPTQVPVEDPGAQARPVASATRLRDPSAATAGARKLARPRHSPKV